MKYLLCLVVLFPTLLLAQREDQPDPEFNWTVSFTNNGVINPGLQVGLEWPFKNSVTIKERKSRRQGTYLLTRRRQYALEGRLGIFWDPLLQVAVYHQYLFTLRAVYQKAQDDRPRWMMAVGIGPGYLRSFIGETYAVDEAGRVERVRLASRGYFTPMWALRFIREHRQREGAWFVEINTRWLLGYNSGTVKYNTLLFGLRYPLKKSKS
ncbi:MAG: hypothetical protein AAFW73_14595 [Bacteroidota bacterium]